MQGPDGPDPLVVLDRELSGSGRWTPPMRLSALGRGAVVDDADLERLALCLGYGLPRGEAQVRAVQRFVAHGIYPYQQGGGRLPPVDVLGLDSGTCGSMNGLLAGLLQALGYETRIVSAGVPRLLALSGASGKGGHTAMEVRWQGGWHYLDAYYDVVTWGRDLASQAGRRDELPALKISADAGPFAGQDEAFRTITLADYAESLRYQHDLWGPARSAAEFVDPKPAVAPGRTVERDLLWPEGTLTLHLRVRVVRAGPEHVRHVFPGGLARSSLPTAFVQVSPWVTRRVQVDLRELPERWSF